MSHQSDYSLLVIFHVCIEYCPFRCASPYICIILGTIQIWRINGKTSRKQYYYEIFLCNYLWSLGYLNQYILTWRCDMLVNWLVIKFAGTVRELKETVIWNIHLGNADVMKSLSISTFSYLKRNCKCYEFLITDVFSTYIRLCTEIWPHCITFITGISAQLVCLITDSLVSDFGQRI